MTRLPPAELSRQFDSLSEKVRASFDGSRLRSTVEGERVLEPRNLKLEEISASDECPLNSQEDLGRGEPRVVECVRNQDRVEGFPRLWKHLGLALHQIHLGTMNAIQAFESLSGPSDSEPSDHAVDFDPRLQYLGRRREGA